MRLSFRPTFLCGPALALVVVLSGCGSNDEAGPEGHHSPVAAVVLIGGTEIDPAETIMLAAGQTVAAEVRFLDDHGDVITGIEDEHYIKLAFDPAGLATSADVSGHHFQKTVTAQASAGTGTVTVGYGHDADADEKSFGPFSVTVAVQP